MCARRALQIAVGRHRQLLGNGLGSEDAPRFFECPERLLAFLSHLEEPIGTGVQITKSSPRRACSRVPTDTIEKAIQRDPIRTPQPADPEHLNRRESRSANTCNIVPRRIRSFRPTIDTALWHPTNSCWVDTEGRQ